MTKLKDPLTKSKKGRKPLEVNWAQVDTMAAMMLNVREIADILDCHRDALNEASKRAHGMTIDDYREKKSTHGKMRMKAAQYKAGVEGNVTAQIWWGKQYLGQSDKLQSEQNIKVLSWSELAKKAIAPVSNDDRSIDTELDE